MLEEERHLDDLAAAYVLGALEPEEVELVELHLARCSDCRALVDEQRQIVDLLPYLPEPRPVPLRARRALLDRIRRADPPNVQELPHRRRLPVRVVRLSWIVAAAAVLVAAVFGWNSLRVQHQADQRASEISALEERQDAVARFVSAPSGFVANLHGIGSASGASGGIILDPTRNAALLVVDGLPAPPPGRAYVVWLVDGSRHVNAGILPVDDQGRAQLFITAQQTLTSFDSIEVTEESGALAAEPSGVRLMAASVDE